MISSIPSWYRRELLVGCAGGLLTLAAGETKAVSCIADTSYGRVQGIRRDGISRFLGIPYGADTSADARFRAPSKPAPWTSVRNATHLGPRCPQSGGGAYTGDLGVFWPTDPKVAPERQAEDCLVLNVWTPATDTAKRPVMVWIHGGAFAFGSAGPYPGENLAKFGDVVVVSVNHRLNLFGHLFLAELAGSEFAESGNAGLLDLVAALQWVRDNAANFGGNAENVTIFGQSGGGAKVSAVMAMPAAKGLFQKAIVESGAYPIAKTPEAASRYAASVLAELGVRPADAASLRRLPAARLLAAVQALAARGAGNIVSFGPVRDGRALPYNPSDPSALALSADVPLIIGTTQTETTVIFRMLGAGPEMFTLDEASLRKRLAVAFHMPDAEVNRLVAGYRLDFPAASPSDIFFLATSDQWRITAIGQAERKVAQAAAPAYMYLFA